MRDRLISFLHAYKKKTVSLGELEKLADGEINYEDFAAVIRILMEQGALQSIKEHGTSLKDLSLANSYRIIKSKLPIEYHREIENRGFILDSRIKLDAYYTLPASVWEDDLPFIQMIDAYLKRQGLPTTAATSQERSYQLVMDEKWIEAGGGRAVLERLKLWDELCIISQPDPLMLAVNPNAWYREPCLHLAVENKTPFHALMDILPETDFLSLIYGAGWKITANIGLLDQQLGIAGCTSRIYYFGDLDNEGINIWFSLHEQCSAQPAVEFYRALLARPAARGKESQRSNERAWHAFLNYFSPAEQERIRQVLGKGGYYAQEGLNASELACIWRNTAWI